MSRWAIAREAATLVGYLMTLYLTTLIGHGYGL